jgi:Ca2+-binding RTX toxin-like protein/RNA 3'-terminal phosphate cyclase
MSVILSSSLVLISDTVANYPALVAGLLPGVEAIVIDSRQDGIAQVTQALISHAYTNIYIIAHGRPGYLEIGDRPLSLDTLEAYTPALSRWFSAPATLSIYGCNVAAGDAGAEFVEKLHRLTGAAIAASAQPVGNAALGGTWELGVMLGEKAIAPLPVEAAVLSQYAGILPVNITSITSTTANGNYAVGSPAINVRVAFDTPVSLVGGDLILTLDSGATVTISAFSLALSANGSYTVVLGNNSADLNVTGVTLASGTLQNSVGTVLVDATVNPVSLTLPTVTNLADNKAIVIDTVAPTVVLASGSPADVNGVFSVTATFSETVNDFVADDVLVGNGAVSNFNGSGNTYTFDVTPSSSGTVSVNVGTGVTQDFANNSNIAATPLIRNADLAPPAVVLTTNSLTNVNGAFEVTATFNEAVTGFVEGDIVVTNATVNSGMTVVGNAYTFTVTPIASGPITVNVPGAAAQDVANNNSTAAAPLTFNADLVDPTVTLTTAAPFDVQGAFSVTATFSEDVTDFVANDVVVTNGSVGSFSGSGKIYTFTVIPAASGTVTVNVPIDVAEDIAMNGNEAANVLTFNADLIAPTIALSSTSLPNVNGVFNVTATFSESVNNFIATDISVFNGTVSNFIGSGATYTFDVTPTANGVVNVNVGSNVAQDIANNGNTPAPLLTRTADLVVPSVVLTSTAPANVNGLFTVTANFSESVTGLLVGEIVATNATIGNLLGSGSTYTFDVTPTTSGAVTVSVPANVVQDIAINNNVASPAFTRNADLVPPTVTLTSASPDDVKGSFSVTATFSESVTNFVAGDITVGNGTVSGFTGSGTTYTFNVIPTTSGAVTVDIAANVAQDIAANINTSATQLTRTADLIAPTVALTSVAPTNVEGTFAVTATFSEAVTNFVATDITLSNGTVSNFLGSGSTYTFDVTPTTSGTVNVNVSANVAQDIANNNNTAAVTLTRSADLVAPTVLLTSTAPTNVKEMFSVTATFSESVTDFFATDIALSNGTISNFSGSGSSYTFDVTPTTSGLVTVGVAANAAIDIATNGNPAALNLTRTADLVAPTVVLTSASPNDVNGIFSVQATFSEAVTNFTVGGVGIVNGTISNFNGSGAIYTFNVTPLASGPITIDVAANVAQDLATNDNTAALQLTRSADLIVPTVALTSLAPVNVKGVFSVTATFSEAVNNFLIGDVAVTNGVVSNFVAVNASTYTFDITPNANGTVTVNVAGSAAQDIANNNSTVAVALTREADIVVPTVALTSTSPANVNGEFFVTATFSESVANFDISDVGVSNGVVSDFTGTGAIYTFRVTPSGSGAIAVNIAAGVAQDIADNGNTAATPLTRIADLVVPTVVLTSSAPADVNGVFSVTATFSETVNNFVIDDITVSNGTASNLVVSGSVYTFDVTPTSNGTVTVGIAADVAQDDANNNNTAAIDLTRNADVTLPSVVLTSAAPDNVNVPFSVTATFSEDVFNFVAGDVTIGNGIVTNFTAVSNSVYTFDILPITDGLVTVNVGAGAAQDIANNNNNAAVSLTRTVDTAQPAVVLSSTALTNVNGSFMVTATFDEAVTGLDVSDIMVANGTIANFDGSGTTYTFEVIPDADGMVTVDIADTVAQDAAGNTNTAANQLNRTADLTLPTVSLTSVAAPEVNQPFVVTATFSEDVSNFVITDITVTNGTVSSFTGSGSTYDFVITPTGNGTVTVAVPANVAQDIANNPNAAAVSLTREADIVSPSAVLTSPSAASISATFSVTATFNEPVINFVQGDVRVGNGFVTNFAGSGNVYTFDVTPIDSGALTIDIDANVTQDTAGNQNTASPTFTRTVDYTPPTVALTSAAPAAVREAFTVTATFDEPVVDFTASDITVTNGTIDSFSGTGTTYTFSVNPGASGIVTIDIADSVATDIGGNPNTAAPSLSRNIDKVPPITPTVAPVLAPGSDTGISAQDGITNNTQPTFTGSGEAGGTVQIFAGQTSLGVIPIAANGQWSFTPTTPFADGKYNITFTLTDSVGNVSPPSPPFALTVETIASKLLKVEIAQDIRETSADVITIQFNEAISNFDLSELTLTNNDRPVSLTGATLTTQDNITWTLSNLGTQTFAVGTYKLSINKGDISDTAGNLLSVGLQETWITGRTGTPLPLIDFGGRTKGDRRGVNRKGTPKNDRILGTPKSDDLRGGKGDDTLIGGFGIPLFGIDRLFGEDGNDNLSGGNDSDFLDGGKGRDRLSGGDGRDVVLGGADNDRLLGGRQDDVLTGGMGNDTLTGGSGRDTFTFNSLTEGVDTIRDFSPTEDLIDLRQIFTRLPAGANSFARYRQFIKLETSGSDVKVNVIADGTERGTAMTLAIVQNTSINAIGSRNFLIQ